MSKSILEGAKISEFSISHEKLKLQIAQLNVLFYKKSTCLQEAPRDSRNYILLRNAKLLLRELCKTIGSKPVKVSQPESLVLWRAILSDLRRDVRTYLSETYGDTYNIFFACLHDD